MVSSLGGCSVTLDIATAFLNCQMKMQIFQNVYNLENSAIIILTSFFEGNFSIAYLRVQVIPALIYLKPFF